MCVLYALCVFCAMYAMCVVYVVCYFCFMFCVCFVPCALCAVCVVCVVWCGCRVSYFSVLRFVCVLYALCVLCVQGKETCTDSWISCLHINPVRGSFLPFSVAGV